MSEMKAPSELENWKSIANRFADEWEREGGRNQKLLDAIRVALIELNMNKVSGAILTLSLAYDSRNNSENPIIEPGSWT